MLPRFSPFDSVRLKPLHNIMDIAQHTSAVQAKEALLERSNRMPTLEETKRVEACAAARVLGNLEAVCSRFRYSAVAVRWGVRSDMEMAEMATVQQAILDLARRNDLSDEQFEEKIIFLLTGRRHIGIDFGKLYRMSLSRGEIVRHVVSSKINLEQVQHIRIDGSDFGHVHTRLNGKDYDRNRYLVLAEFLITKYPGLKLSLILKRDQHVDVAPGCRSGPIPPAVQDDMVKGVARMLEESKIVALDLSGYKFDGKTMRELAKAAGLCSTLRHLSLSGNHLGGLRASVSQEFIKSIACCKSKSLESLELNGCSLDGAAVAAIVKAAPKSTLAHLELGNSETGKKALIGEVDGNELAEALSERRKLSRLHLPTVIDAEALLAILGKLSDSPLAELVLSGGPLSAGQGEEAVQQLLNHRMTLTKLSWHDIGNKSSQPDLYNFESVAQNIAYFAEQLPKFTQLRVLDLSNNDLSDDRNVQAIAYIPPRCGLKELHVSECGISVDGQIALVRAAANSKTLSYLNLTGNALMNYSPLLTMEFIAIQLQNPQLRVQLNKGIDGFQLVYNFSAPNLIPGPLQHLLARHKAMDRLVWQGLDPQSIRLVIGQLREFRELRILNLADSNLWDKQSVQAIADIISNDCPREGGLDFECPWEELDLSGCGISAEGVLTLVMAAVQSKNCLQRLRLARNGFLDEKTVKAIADALPGSGWTELDLSGCNGTGIPPEGVLALAEAAARTPTLTYLNLAENFPLSPQQQLALTAIQQRNPKLRIECGTRKEP